jgi:hypothetical protein
VAPRLGRTAPPRRTVTARARRYAEGSRPGSDKLGTPDRSNADASPLPLNRKGEPWPPYRI